MDIQYDDCYKQKDYKCYSRQPHKELSFGIYKLDHKLKDVPNQPIHPNSKLSRPPNLKKYKTISFLQ